MVQSARRLIPLSVQRLPVEGRTRPCRESRGCHRARALLRLMERCGQAFVLALFDACCRPFRRPRTGPCRGRVGIGIATAEYATEQALGLVSLLSLALDPVQHANMWACAHDEPAVGQAANVCVVWEVTPELGVELPPGQVLPGALTRAVESEVGLERCIRRCAFSLKCHGRAGGGRGASVWRGRSVGRRDLLMGDLFRSL